MLPDLHALPAVDIARRIRRREVSSLEVVEAHVARIEELCAPFAAVDPSGET
jgi:Asp-tRNA(Asn)/Glu-tRNA(Gln) amidotransferase A subunit family amidase